MGLHGLIPTLDLGFSGYDTNLKWGKGQPRQSTQLIFNYVFNVSYLRLEAMRDN